MKNENKFYRIIVILLVSFLWPPMTSAQVKNTDPSPDEMALSLQVGNEYTYTYRYNYETKKVQYTIVGDSLDEETGDQYYFLNCTSNSVYGGCGKFDGMYRVVETDSVFFMHRDSRWERQGLLYNLDDSIGSKWSIKPGEFYYGMKTEDEYDLQIFDEIRHAKEFRLYAKYDPDTGEIYPPIYENFLIADEFGIVEWEELEGGAYLQLQGAVINGKAYGDTTFTAIEINQSNALPNNVELRQNYPNPFNPQTTIQFRVPYSMPIKLRIYDIRGGLITTLLNRRVAAGKHKIKFNTGAHHLPSGLYFYELQTPAFTQVKKMTLIK